MLQVNFRGSTGFGKKFLHAGDRQWGCAMHDDLLDAVAWAVKEGVADPKRVAIMRRLLRRLRGARRRGLHPRRVPLRRGHRGPVEPLHPAQVDPARTGSRCWPCSTSAWATPTTPRTASCSSAPRRSSRRDKIKIPLLIGQGANDPRVKQAESEQIVAAIEKNRGRAVYVLYPDEGHGFARPENRIDFFARAEAFLAEHLGGRAELLEGQRIKGSTAVVKVVGGKK